MEGGSLDSKRSTYVALAMGVGLILGVLIGSFIFDSPGLGISFGVVGGGAVGASSYQSAGRALPSTDVERPRQLLGVSVR